MGSPSMNDYEARRQAKIKRNQALLAELNITRRDATTDITDNDGKPAKRRKILYDSTPSRASARIAATTAKPDYNDDAKSKGVPLPRLTPKKRLGTKKVVKDEPEALVPVKDVQEIQKGWTDWEAVASEPVRDEDGTFHFKDFPDFTPNKSPEEMIREGCFGGSYYRPLRSRKLGIVVEDDWKELPADWIHGLNTDRYLTSTSYDPDVNKFKVSCGQSIEEWEANGWISHEHDVRGWMQWYTRFWQGRRCEDDARQVSRWKKCVGETGRWRRMLLKKYVQMGVKEVFDDGDDEDGKEVSPVMHQTCHHWAYEVRQGDLDRYWAEGR